MKLAIMQPYFFPYIGYWQLIHAADRFVIYDDVAYIKGGWVNRNRLLINGEPVFVTAPLQQPSSYKRICDTALQHAPWWRDKLIRTVAITYRKAPCFDVVFPLVEQLVRHETAMLSDYLAHQLQTLAAFMGITTEFVLSSRGYQNAQLSGQERVLDICKKEGAGSYLNAQGGQTLYASDAFGHAGIDLRFIVMQPLPYQQSAGSFVPYLSIIDALMAIGPTAIRQHLDAFHLISNQNPPMQVNAGASYA